MTPNSGLVTRKRDTSFPLQTDIVQIQREQRENAKDGERKDYVATGLHRDGENTDGPKRNENFPEFGTKGKQSHATA